MTCFTGKIADIDQFGVAQLGDYESAKFLAPAEKCELKLPFRTEFEMECVGEQYCQLNAQMFSIVEAQAACNQTITDSHRFYLRYYCDISTVSMEWPM